MNTLPNTTAPQIRMFSPYEQTQLARHNLLFTDMDNYGEMPVEYITRSAPFCGHEFTLSRDVLIPRIETEQLVSLAQEQVLQLPVFQMNGMVVLADIGTGSGAIGVSLSHILSTLNVNHTMVYSDISQSALKTSQTNAASLLPDTYSHTVKSFFVHSDLLADIPRGVMFDVIVANLPYIPSSRISSLHESVKDYEPHLALDGGPDGLDLIHALLHQAKDRLKPSGVILLEIDHTHTQNSFKDFAEIYSFDILQDDAGLNRFLLISL